MHMQSSAPHSRHRQPTASQEDGIGALCCQLLACTCGPAYGHINRQHLERARKIPRSACCLARILPALSLPACDWPVPTTMSLDNTKTQVANGQPFVRICAH